MRTKFIIPHHKTKCKSIDDFKKLFNLQLKPFGFDLCTDDMDFVHAWKIYDMQYDFNKNENISIGRFFGKVFFKSTDLDDKLISYILIEQ